MMMTNRAVNVNKGNIRDILTGAGIIFFGLSLSGGIVYVYQTWPQESALTCFVTGGLFIFAIVAKAIGSDFWSMYE